MRKLGIDEWIVRLVTVMYDGANSRVKVSDCFNEMSEVTFGVHQGYVLSPLLFAIVMEALSRDCRISCPWEILPSKHSTLIQHRYMLKQRRDVGQRDIHVDSTSICQR